MCRRVKRTVGKDAQWLVGQRGRLCWALYWTGRPSKGRLKWWREDGHQYLMPYQLRSKGEAMAKRVGITPAGDMAKGLGPAFGDLGKVAPQLCSWLCDTTYEDGSEKGRTQLQVERKGDRVRCLLKVADGGVCVESHNENLTDALLSLELLLGSDECPWTLDPFPFAKPAKKRR